jgi:uncharacterized protein YbaR (Trm112 family)
MNRLTHTPIRRATSTGSLIWALVLSDPHILTCPSCSTPLAAVRRERFEVIGRKHWLRDGDTIPGIYESLGSCQADPSGFICSLNVGDCPHCRLDYYVVEAQMMNAPWDDAEPYLCFNVPLGAGRNSLCTMIEPIAAVPASWVMQEFDTPLGLMQSHIFGPWRLDDPAIVSGPWGVMSCCSEGTDDPWGHGASLLLKVWDALRALHPQISQKGAADAAHHHA